MARLRVCVLISGRGSNLRALIEACADPGYPAEILLVISSRPEAPGLAVAARAGLPSAAIPDRNRQAFAREAQALLRGRGIELVCLAGFMRVLDPGFVEAWRDRMINIHPSLLPSFPGLHAQKQALEAGVRFTDCTVHFVRREVDSGPIIGQGVVPIYPDDDEPRLSARILRLEHRLYPLALKLVAEGRVRTIADKVEIDGGRVPEIAALNPEDCPGKPLASVSC